jgi:hypothetical protein
VVTRHRFVDNPHDALVLRGDLVWLADAWVDLLDHLGRDQPPPDGQPRATTPVPGLVINEHVSDLMRRITQYARALAHLLATETDDWTPPTPPTTPALLLAAATRVGHFTTRPDDAVKAGVPALAADLRRQVTRAAYPDGIHTLHLTRFPCRERVIDATGHLGWCPGHWTIRPRPTGALGDMVCSVNPDHHVPPYRWLRIVRRAAAHDAAADALVSLLSPTASR